MTDSKRIVVVFGATGAQGGSVAKELVKNDKYTVRAVTRSLDSAPAQQLKELGCHVIQADLTKPATLKPALDGAYAVFAVTDFYALGDREFEVGAALARLAKEGGVTHYLWSTLADVDKGSGGKYYAPHFTNKAKVDDVIRDLRFKHHTFVQGAFYFQNFASERWKPTRTEPDGTVVFSLPVNSSTKFEAYDVDDTGAAVLNALEHPATWHDLYMPLVGTHTTIRRFLEIFEAVTGKKARFETVPDEKLPLKAWAGMYGWMREYGCFGDADISLARRCNPDLKTWEEWLRLTGWAGAP